MKLKPCPWCGSKVTIEYQCGLQYSMPQWRVQCPECGTMAVREIYSPNIAGKARARKQLARWWNEGGTDMLADHAGFREKLPEYKKELSIKEEEKNVP